jgi:hypothetical protein
MGPLETGEGTESSRSRGSGKPASATLVRFACGWTRFGSFSAAGRDIGPVDPFGFSWPLAVSLRKPPLMAVGFSWISLDSLVRIETFQWVTRLEVRQTLSDRPGRCGRARKASEASHKLRGTIVSCGHGILTSDLQQGIVARALPFGRRLTSKGTRVRDVRASDSVFGLRGSAPTAICFAYT